MSRKHKDTPCLSNIFGGAECTNDNHYVVKRKVFDTPDEMFADLDTRVPCVGDTVAVTLDDENGSVVVGRYDEHHPDGFHRILSDRGNSTWMLVVPPDADIKVLKRPGPVIPPVPARPFGDFLIGQPDGEPTDDELWETDPFTDELKHVPDPDGDEDEIDWATWADLWRAAHEVGARVYRAVEVMSYERGEEVGT